MAEETEATQKHRFIKIDKPLEEDVLLLHDFTGTETLGRPFVFNLGLLSEKNHEIDMNEVIGKQATIWVELQTGEGRYFNGFISSFAQMSVGRPNSDDKYSSYQATMVPWLWLLTRTADCRIFQDMIVPDIIKKVFGDYGFGGFVEDRLTCPNGPYRVWEYCVQYRETAFNFVSRLMEQEGIYYFFKHEKGKHFLVLCDSKGAHLPYPDYEELPFRPTRPDAEPKGYISEWTIEKSIQPGIFTHTDYNFEKPRTPMLQDPFTWPFSEIQRGHQHADFEVFDYPGEFTLTPEGNSYAKTRIEELQATHEIGSGSSSARGIAAGYKLKMKNNRRTDQNREYLVTSSSYRAETAAYDTGGGGSDEFGCTYTAIPSDTSYRTPRSTLKPVVQGAQTAVVVGPPGDEIFTDKYGRVKVQFHWDREHEYEPKSSCWIRVAQTWASKKWGTIYIPRIGQEVIVDFLEGDPDRPIITGCVYNADMMPPYDLPVQKVVSGTKTNSTIGGGGYNELSMDDTKGKEKITIHGQFDMSSTIEHDHSLTVHNNHTSTVDGTHTEKIKKDTSITITEGKLTHRVEKGTADYYVKDKLTEQCDAMRVSQAKSTIHLISENEDIWIKATKHILVDSNGKSTAKFEPGGHIEINGADSIRLVSGASLIDMKKDGAILISGTKIEIAGTDEAKLGVGNQNVLCDKGKVATSGASINATAIGVHEISGAMVKIN